MSFFEYHSGEFAALLTACFWTITSLSFESASNKIGSVSVNILRLVIGFVFLSIFTLIYRGMIFPADAGSLNWFWLILSGLVGFVFGDLFLFKSYTLIGSRFAMLIMTLVPPLTAFFGFIILGERLTMFNFLGMALAFTGIAIAIFSRNGNGDRLSLKLSPRGIIYAFGGAVGQALGLILSKLGMRDYDPFAATQIRILAGIIGFTFLVTVLKRWNAVTSSVLNRPAMIQTTTGAFFGPFLGVSFSLVAIKNTEAGIASTIMALVPVLIILPAVVLYKQKVTFAEVAGAFISVAGVALFFI
ncbi:MAG TPA: EamA family transporter [Bacteroidales bacterium]|nr:EamA family transporter [Bacteroidales bacterium]HBZ19662.1 EamA family transporter [Bacteroidales bacterium]